MMKDKNRKGDSFLIIAVLILLLLGLMTVYSASSFKGAEKYNDPTTYIKPHAISVGIGLVFLFLFSKIEYHKYRWLTPLALVVLSILLVVVLFGAGFQGSKRSLVLFGKQFQPSEFLKLTIIFYLAAIFAKGEKSKVFKANTLMVHFTIVVMLIGLVFIEPDLGTSLVLFFIALSMFYLGGVSWKKLLQMGLSLVPIVMLGLLLFPHQRQRLSDYIGSMSGTGPMSYQIRQSIIGLAQGGLTGAGYGSGKQKLFFLPEPFSDFVLASLGEELGFIGLVLLFVLLGFILWRGIRIAIHAPDRYGALLAGGVSAMILINALINAGVVVNLLPTTGLPFPFLSYGGSSLLVHSMGIGILVNISKRAGISYRRFTQERSRAPWLEEED